MAEVLSPREHLATSQDILVITPGEGGLWVAAGIYWVEARDVAEQATVRRMTPTRNYPAQDVNSARMQECWGWIGNIQFKLENNNNIKQQLPFSECLQ